MTIESIGIGTCIVLFGIGCCAIHENSPIVRERQLLRKTKYMKYFEKIEINSKKRQYINELIDEIPDLSYYEAKQLQKKLGNIYIEWNNE